ncbi:MAG TPA: AAC(3) family N-acetyltransferase [Flavobacteriales bacterium]|nr:AAC(3) family N-acetyltransferase [Flavobacteriales bacterium]
MSERAEPGGWPERMGIAPGAELLLTADVTRISWLLRHRGARNAPRALLDAFLSAVGPGGTIVVPTFNYDLRTGESFDPRRTPTITGALGLAALEHPAFVRTANPLHSFAVAGRLQREFLAADDTSSFSEGSPFALLRTNGFILLGLDMHLNYALSYFHHVEELEAVPYRKWRTVTIRCIDATGASKPRQFRIFAKRAGYANELSALVPRLKEAGAMTTGNTDGVEFLKVDLAKAHEVIARDIRSNKAGSIVRFTLRNWLRDTWHALFPMRGPSRSARLLMEQDAGAL